MENLRAILDEVYPMIKLKMAMRRVKKQIPLESHWAFCYTLLNKLSRSFAFVIQQLDGDLRDAVCIFYLVLRALDTVEDDTSIPAEVKVPILMAFHSHISDCQWHFSCGRNDYKVLMDQFHHVSTSFLELERSYQEPIKDITMKMGAGMSKFVCKEVETIDDYDEYCHYVSGLVGLGLSKLFHASGKEDLASDTLSNAMGVFLEELKHEENSIKAVQCLNDMVTNALTHADDCLKYMSALQDPAIFRFCAIPQIVEFGTLAMCYNNIQVFRRAVKMRRGLTAKVIDRTKTMPDVYRAFYDFACMLKSKVDYNDPNARKTKDVLESILKTCRDSGTLNERFLD
ncbi:Squalene synthase [Forsythia ovata]|uniref:Squalene synthase n=1 Tax=Forsythia ovata TaxID=205694 RepID=A0ABD1VJS0_9LAMI